MTPLFVHMPPATVMPAVKTAPIAKRTDTLQAILSATNHTEHYLLKPLFDDLSSSPQTSSRKEPAPIPQTSTTPLTPTPTPSLARTADGSRSSSTVHVVHHKNLDVEEKQPLRDTQKTGLNHTQ